MASLTHRAARDSPRRTRTNSSSSSPSSSHSHRQHHRSFASSDPLELIPEDFRPYEVPTPRKSQPQLAHAHHRRAFSQQQPAPASATSSQRQQHRASSLDLSHPRPRSSADFYQQHLSSSSMFNFAQSDATVRRAGNAPALAPARPGPAPEQTPSASSSPNPNIRSASPTRTRSNNGSNSERNFIRKLWRNRSDDSDDELDFGCAGELEFTEPTTATVAPLALRPRVVTHQQSSSSIRSSSTNRHSTGSSSSSSHVPSLTHSRGASSSSSVSSVCLSPALPGSPTFHAQQQLPQSPLCPYTSRVPLTPRTQAREQRKAQEQAAVEALDQYLSKTRLSRVEEVLSERGSERGSGSWEPRRPGGVQVDLDLTLDLEVQFDDALGSDSTFTPAFVPLDLAVNSARKLSTPSSDAGSDGTFAPLKLEIDTSTFFPASSSLHKTASSSGSSSTTATPPRAQSASPPLHSDDIASTLEELSAFFTSSASSAPLPKNLAGLAIRTSPASAPCSPRIGSNSPRPKMSPVMVQGEWGFQPKVLAARVDAVRPEKRRSGASYSWI